MAQLHKSPSEKRLERLTKNPREAIDFDVITWKAYMRTTPRDFGMYGKHSKQKRRN